MQNGLIVEEVKHELDCKRQRTLTICHTEDCLQQIVHKLLHGNLSVNLPTQQLAGDPRNTKPDTKTST